ncbi:uncharacterized protein N7511_009693 [Penicillium nucicola]|uniref:uncharacterized protein n=1 Tax=Penicillium nucicola TaxID=1850975 RepID=UPI002545394D|nr:uncharacterized protein N7511_009693 [Penicillium nucicola]KAJ5747997.1 hypothetical protein N7511_009693 [Penicillium nucicola]
MPIMEEELETTPLSRSINDLSETRLRAVLKSICAQNDEARKEAESQLLVATTDSGESTESKKRQRSRYAFCETCKEEFDVTTNTDESCRCHPEKCEPTEELYVDNDFAADEFGVDNDDNRAEFPEWFRFDCCGGNLRDDPGCELDYHKERSPLKSSLKRARGF